MVYTGKSHLWVLLPQTDEHVLGKASNNQTGWQHQFYGAFLRRAFPVFKKIINFYQTL